jgi:hypothetical protein
MNELNELTNFDYKSYYLANYIDDNNEVMHWKHERLYFQLSIKHYAEIGIKINKSKTRIIANTINPLIQREIINICDSPNLNDKIKYNFNGNIESLGVYHGTKDFINEKLNEKIEKSLIKIEHLDFVSQLYILFNLVTKFYGFNKWYYLLKTVDKYECVDKLYILHTKLEHLLTKYLTFSPTLVHQLSLSQKRGGFGLRRPSNFESAAKISSFRNKENEIERYFPFLNDFNLQIPHYMKLIENNNLINEINFDNCKNYTNINISNNNMNNDNNNDINIDNDSKDNGTEPHSNNNSQYPKLYAETAYNINYGLNCVSNLNNFDKINNYNNNNNILIVSSSDALSYPYFLNSNYSNYIVTLYNTSISKFIDIKNEKLNDFNSRIHPSIYNPDDHRKQSQLIELIDKIALDKIMNLNDERTNARMLSLGSSGALSFLHMPYNCHYGFKPTNIEFITAMKWVLGCKMTMNDKPSCNLCKKIIDPFGDHAVSCTEKGQLILKHNAFADALEIEMKRGGLDTKREIKYKSDDNGNFDKFNDVTGVPGDILVKNFNLTSDGKESDMYYDVTIVNPIYKSYIKDAQTFGQVTRKKEKLKHEKYKKKDNIKGICIDTFGNCGPNMKEIMFTIANLQSVKYNINTSIIMNWIRSRLISNLMKNNIQMILKSLTLQLN